MALVQRQTPYSRTPVRPAVRPVPAKGSVVRPLPLALPGTGRAALLRPVSIALLFTLCLSTVVYGRAQMARINYDTLQSQQEEQRLTMQKRALNAQLIEKTNRKRVDDWAARHGMVRVETPPLVLGAAKTEKVEKTGDMRTR